MFDGALVLTAEAGLRQDVREADGALIDFWRPVTFGPSEKPIGGRMDCKLGGVREDFSDALFDIRQRYKDERDMRKVSGLKDDGSDYAEDGAIRRLEVTGRAFPRNGAQPTIASRPLDGRNELGGSSAREGHWHYVVTYLALRADPYLYDIRLNCEFRHLDEPGGKTDYPAIMRQYVDIGIPVAAPTAPPPPLPDSQS